MQRDKFEGIAFGQELDTERARRVGARACVVARRELGGGARVVAQLVGGSAHDERRADARLDAAHAHARARVRGREEAQPEVLLAACACAQLERRAERARTVAWFELPSTRIGPRHVSSRRQPGMLCHVMSCHVMSCHVMSCHVMSCHVMSCHVMSCHGAAHLARAGECAHLVRHPRPPDGTQHARRGEDAVQRLVKRVAAHHTRRTAPIALCSHPGGGRAVRRVEEACRGARHARTRRVRVHRRTPPPTQTHTHTHAVTATVRHHAHAHAYIYAWQCVYAYASSRAHAWQWCNGGGNK
jgi:hypothetical protein